MSRIVHDPKNYNPKIVYLQQSQNTTDPCVLLVLLNCLDKIW